MLLKCILFLFGGDIPSDAQVSLLALHLGIIPGDTQGLILVLGVEYMSALHKASTVPTLISLQPLKMPLRKIKHIQIF